MGHDNMLDCSSPAQGLAEIGRREGRPTCSAATACNAVGRDRSMGPDMQARGGTLPVCSGAPNTPQLRRARAEAERQCRTDGDMSADAAMGRVKDAACSGPMGHDRRPAVW